MAPRTPLADDVLRFAFEQGPGRDFIAPLGPPERPLTTSFGQLPASVRTDRGHPLATGTVDLLEDTAYPTACEDNLAVAERWQHALVMAFGLQRREPCNLFNDHRSLASVRSRFPVHAFVHADDGAWFLDVYRHSLLPLGDGPSELAGRARPLGLTLAGRYTHLPSLYGRLRGPLVELEVGIGLRSLWVALDVFGLRGRLHLPGANGGPSARPLAAALDPPGEWTSALFFDLDDPGAPASKPDGRHRPAEHPAPSTTPAALSDDPTLEEVAAVHRCALATADTWADTGSSGAAPGLPIGIAPTEVSWADVLWRRSAGHMPRQLPGFSGRRRALPSAAVSDAVAWVSARPPTPLLAAVAEHIGVSVCLQDVAGYATGWYRVAKAADDQARLELARADPSLPAQLEACYGHRLAPQAGSAVRHAAMTWVVSAKVASLIDRFGPGGWTLAQYACGWMAHGLCLSAAAHGCYARPTRAFDEVLLHPAVGTESGETVLLSVVCGAGRFIEPALDLRN